MTVAPGFPEATATENRTSDGAARHREFMHRVTFNIWLLDQAERRQWRKEKRRRERGAA
jgi:hypothetical protein